jgi:hypothetical protein
MIEMAVLVAYASKHGATHEIAERIAQTLTGAGQQAQVRSVSAAGDLAGYDAFVISIAVYMGHWQKEPEFVRRNRAVLVGGPCDCSAAGRWVPSRPALEAEERQVRHGHAAQHGPIPAPAIRLLGMRAPPQRAANRLTGRRDGGGGAPAAATFA